MYRGDYHLPFLMLQPCKSTCRKRSWHRTGGLLSANTIEAETPTDEQAEPAEQGGIMSGAHFDRDRRPVREQNGSCRVVLPDDDGHVSGGDGAESDGGRVIEDVKSC